MLSYGEYLIVKPGMVTVWWLTDSSLSMQDRPKSHNCARPSSLIKTLRYNMEQLWWGQPTAAQEWAYWFQIAMNYDRLLAMKVMQPTSYVMYLFWLKVSMVSIRRLSWSSYQLISVRLWVLPQVFNKISIRTPLGHQNGLHITAFTFNGISNELYDVKMIEVLPYFHFTR